MNAPSGICRFRTCKSSCTCTSVSSTVISLTVRGASSTFRLPQVTSPHGRFTFGLRQFLGQLGQQQGGASAACSATLMGMQVTARAILRFMHILPLPPIAPPRIIGLDDWAWKRGQRYGAVVVDLERKKPIALLAGRSQEAVAGWLKHSPTIQIVARDRSKEFAAAITAACPRPNTWLIGGTSPKI
jgi:hypothetical protein